MIREVPDFPKPGILFYDITTLLDVPEGLELVDNELAEIAVTTEVDVVAGMESRGFLFGPMVALRLSTGFVLLRKPGKLPAETVSVSYDLEYGTDSLEMHTDSILPDQRVLIVDDLLATGGTAEAAIKLIEKAGGEVAGLLFVIELDFLKGRERLAGYDVMSLLHYDS